MYLFISFFNIRFLLRQVMINIPLIATFVALIACTTAENTIYAEVSSDGHVSTRDTGYPSSSIAFPSADYESTIQEFPSLSTHRSRLVDTILESKEQSEGRGARVRRSIGRREVPNFDPFLMLDEFTVALPASFLDHPHRGIETVTYLLDDSLGSIHHEDHKGNRGTISAGDTQWLTAGKGIIHAEVPSSHEHPAHGMQLWVSLPKAHKLAEPRYQEVPNSALSRASQACAHAEVIAGSALGVSSDVRTFTPIHYVKYRLEPHCTVVHPLESTWNAFIYVLNKGPVLLHDAHAVFDTRTDDASANTGTNADISTGTTAKPGSRTVPAHHLATLRSNPSHNGVTIASTDEETEFLLVAGQPLNEPIVQHGPFVMNSREEIGVAFADYRGARNGFEGAREWRSEIGRTVTG